MIIVYDVKPNGKKIPYMVPNNTDTQDEDFDPTSGLPIQFTDISRMEWERIITTLHNTYMNNQFFNIADVNNLPENRKRFIEVTKSILTAEVLKYFSRG